MFKLTDKNMKKSAKLWMVILFLFTGAGRVTAQIPSTRIYDGEKLAKVKARMESKEYASATTKLMNEADKALKNKPVSVMDKTMVAGSGDKHDYVSMGPYWWPDPTKPDGLPYIRKDGVRNPNATSDCTNIGKTINDISTLGIAYYFSGNEKYAAKAAELIRVWFLNPETRMNPNMNYAQMIPGHNENKGRGFGMIDVYAFINLLDAVEMMNTSTAFTTADRSGLKDWFTDYLEWIRTSPVADEARTSENNHGVSFDVQQTDKTPEELQKELYADVTQTMSPEQLKDLNTIQQISAQISSMTSPWYLHFMRYDPAEDLKELKCPVLALNGEKDIQVDATMNLTAIQEKITGNGNKNVTIKAYPNLNHLFQTCEKGTLAEYGQLEETISPEVLKDIMEWIKKQ